MKRQNVRKMITLISFLLFPVTIYYFSPYLIIMGAFEGIITGSFIIFAAMFLSSIFLGRLFCGWLCPVGGLQDCSRLVSDKKAKGGIRNYIKYLIWAPWILLITVMLLRAGGANSVDFLFMTTNGISVAAPEGYIIYYAVLLLIIVLAFTAGRRSFCHYVCWMAPFLIIGNKIGRICRIPSVKLGVEKNKCTSCKTCESACPMSLSVEQMVSKGSMENSECVLCGECSDACPNKVIRYRFGK
jgi:ferredoxin-type protein NapH